MTRAAAADAHGPDVVLMDRTLAETGVAYQASVQLSSVLEVVYLIFNEGYAATSGADLIRADLCLEALRLGRLFAVLAPDQAEVHGLAALMEIQQSRSAARAVSGCEGLWRGRR